MSENIDRINAVLDGFDGRVRAVAPDAWTNASPCEGWTARDVVVHVADNLLRLSGGLQGAPLEPVGAEEDIVAAWDRARGAFATTLETADLGAVLPGPWGPMPAEQMIGRIMATDALVHTWDLARATGGDEQLPVELVEGAYSGLKPMDAMIRVPGVFGAKTEAPEGADVQTEFLCFLGRTV